MQPGSSKYPDWLPYFGPMIAFIGLLQFGEMGLGVWSLALRVVVPLAAFLFFFKEGCYPELRDWKPGVGVVGDVLVGLLVTLVWVAPYFLVPSLRPDPGEAFDPGKWGEGSRQLALALRFAGFAFVTPFIEELLVRSYIHREAEVFQQRGDFRTVAVGRFGWTGFIVTLLWFTFTHLQWEWPVAAATCVIYNLWLYKRRHIGSLILAHAVTNASLFLFVALGSGKIGDGHDLWYFL